MPEIKEKHEKILEKFGNMIRLHFRETNQQANAGNVFFSSKNRQVVWGEAGKDPTKSQWERKIGWNL